MRKGTIFTLIILFFCCCSEEQHNTYHSITLIETIISDTNPVYKTETYSFTNDLVTSLNVLQNYLESRTTFGTQLAYETNTVTRTDINGKQAIYTLNANGYATRCHYEEADIQRDYTFSYSTDNFLERIEESVNRQPHSTLAITYNEGDITCVALNGAPIIYQHGTDENKYAFPSLPLLESYPMEYHKEAYFSGLLGKPTRHFTTRTTYQDNETEWTEYTYSFTSQSELTSIRTKMTYSGKVYDSKGKEHITTSVINRQIVVNMK